MKVCFFGSYTTDPVISVFKKKLELLNIEVVECHEDINISLQHISIPSVIKSFVKLFFKHEKKFCCKRGGFYFLFIFYFNI